MFRKLITVAALAAVVASGAFAQRGGGGGGRGGGGGFGGFGGGQRASKSDEIAKELKLEKEDKAALETILQDARKELQALMQPMQDGRLGIVQAHVANQPPDGAIQKMAGAHAQVLSLEAKTFAKILEKVDAKQKSKAPKAFQLLTEFFEQPGGFPGGGMGRGGR